MPAKPENQPEVILRVKNLVVELEGEVILDNLSFEIGSDEVVAILGPNGAGKTVLLKTLLGLLPHQGTVEWASGIRLGYVPQRLPFIKDIPLSVKEFFKLKRASKAETIEILSAIGLSKDSLDKKIGFLSSGQFQRILIGWALVSNPRVLLFDEPTTGIDIGGQESIYQLLAKLSKERELTILLVTHDLSVISGLVNRCICLNKKMICNSAPQELTPECLTQLHHGSVKYHEHHHD
jgi:zinc transport system ATP-binding protein